MVNATIEDIQVGEFTTCTVSIQEAIITYKGLAIARKLHSKISWYPYDNRMEILVEYAWLKPYVYADNSGMYTYRLLNGIRAAMKDGLFLPVDKENGADEW